MGRRKAGRVGRTRHSVNRAEHRIRRSKPRRCDGTVRVYGREVKATNATPPCGPTSRRVKTLGRDDQIVEWIKSEKRPAWMDERAFEALPDTIVVREVRRSLNHPGGRKREIVLVTSLLDEKKYPADELVALYARRWQIEVHLRTVKHTLRLDVLRSKSVDGVLKELTMVVLVYNMVRLIMLQAAGNQNVPVDRVSFVDALRWWQNAGPGERVPRLQINPSRPGRHEPRVRKRRAKAYPVMQKPRHARRRRAPGTHAMR